MSGTAESSSEARSSSSSPSTPPSTTTSSSTPTTTSPSTPTTSIRIHSPSPAKTEPPSTPSTSATSHTPSAPVTSPGAICAPPAISLSLSSSIITKLNDASANGLDKILTKEEIEYSKEKFTKDAQDEMLFTVGDFANYAIDSLHAARREIVREGETEKGREKMLTSSKYKERYDLLNKNTIPRLSKLGQLLEEEEQEEEARAGGKRTMTEVVEACLLYLEEIELEADKGGKSVSVPRMDVRLIKWAKDLYIQRCDEAHVGIQGTKTPSDVEEARSVAERHMETALRFGDQSENSIRLMKLYWRTWVWRQGQPGDNRWKRKG